VSLFSKIRYCRYKPGSVAVSLALVDFFTVAGANPLAAEAVTWALVSMCTVWRLAWVPEDLGRLIRSTVCIGTHSSQG
jgi:hypothetical protein